MARRDREYVLGVPEDDEGYEMDDEDEMIARRRASLALLGDEGEQNLDDALPARRQRGGRDEVIHDIEEPLRTVAPQVVEEMSEAFGDEIDRAESVAQRMRTSDQLAFKAALRDDKWRELREIAPFVRPNPSSILRGTFGGQQEVSSGKTEQVALWQGDDPETLPISVTLAPVEQVVTVTAIGAPPSFRPFGIVQFGTRGFMVKAEVDIGKGCQFTVSASAVSLQVAMDPVARVSGVAVQVPGTMKLTGMLSCYPIERSMVITRTRYVDDPAAQSNFVVPPFAKELTFLRDETIPVVINFKDALGAVIYSTVMPAGTTRTTLLSPDIALIDVVAGGGVTGRLVFGLEF